MKLRLKLWLDYFVGSLLLVLLRPPTVLLGRVLGRNHHLDQSGDVTLIKMLGGGSLVIAYPSLLALKRSPRVRKLRLLTTPAIRPFAQILDVFDEIIVIREDSLWKTALDSIKAIWYLFRTDNIVDLEIYSRLTTVFALLTCARNRISFFTNASFWRRNISTHLLFCNVANGIHEFYDQVARLFGGEIPDAGESRTCFQKSLGGVRQSPEGVRRIAVAPGCSDLSRERMLRPDEWALILQNEAKTGPCEFEFLGGKGDRETIDAILAALGEGHTVRSLAGDLPLAESVRRLASAERLICIDSALLHFSRLIGTPVTAYFGPTDPAILLRPMNLPGEKIHYTRISCSPCVHLATSPPCRGNNLCMRFAVNPEAKEDRNPIWA